MMRVRYLVEPLARSGARWQSPPEHRWPHNSRRPRLRRGARSSTTVDLAPALAPDGSFRGAAGLQGRVDASAWALASDINGSEAPRFDRRSALPGPAAAASAISDVVLAIAVSGTNLYVGGWFQDAGGNQWADFIARWDGTTWHNLGKDSSGVDGALTGYVRDIEISGSSVYVGGGFQNAAGIARADAIARWNGSRWSALGADDTGHDGALKAGVVTAIAIFGSDVYVGGAFTAAADIQNADYLARWDGTQWHAVGAGPGGAAALNWRGVRTRRPPASSSMSVAISGTRPGNPGRT